MNINMEDIKSAIIDLIEDNKENCEMPSYDEGGYDAGYTDGYNDGLVDLLNRLGIKLHGSNKLPEPEMKKWYDFAKEALSEKITMILIAIAVLQLFLGFMGVMELSDPIMILVVLAIVTVIAVKTGLGVQKSAAELRAKTAVRYCDVIRDGKVQTINKDELVVGDIVCIEMGQEIFADGYIVEGKISVNNAAINGETKECKKSPIPGYIHAKTTSTSAYTNPNCLFAGTTVMAGEGKMVVTDVGVNTVNGDTMVKMQTLESPKTALDIALDNLSDFISKWGTIAAAVTFEKSRTVETLLPCNNRSYVQKYCRLLVR